MGRSPPRLSESTASHRRRQRVSGKLWKSQADRVGRALNASERTWCVAPSHATPSFNKWASRALLVKENQKKQRCGARGWESPRPVLHACVSLHGAPYLSAARSGGHSGHLTSPSGRQEPPPRPVGRPLKGGGRCQRAGSRGKRGRSWRRPHDWPARLSSESPATTSVSLMNGERPGNWPSYPASWLPVASVGPAPEGRGGSRTVRKLLLCMLLRNALRIFRRPPAVVRYVLG